MPFSCSFFGAASKIPLFCPSRCFPRLPHFLFRPNPMRWALVEFSVLPHGGATSGFGFPVGTRPAVSGKPDTAATRGSRGWTGGFLPCLLERFQAFSDAFLLTFRVQLCKLLLIKLLDRELNGQWSFLRCHTTRLKRGVFSKSARNRLESLLLGWDASLPRRRSHSGSRGQTRGTSVRGSRQLTQQSRRKRMYAFTACVRFLRHRSPAGLREAYS